jgi:hypothetical protein
VKTLFFVTGLHCVHSFGAHRKCPKFVSLLITCSMKYKHVVTTGVLSTPIPLVSGEKVLITTGPYPKGALHVKVTSQNFIFC